MDGTSPRLGVPYPPGVSIVDERGRAILGRSKRVRLADVLRVLVAVVIGLAGYLIGSSRDRHAATATVLRGTVTWSNQQTRLVAFQEDGVTRQPNDGDAIYSVVAGEWQDASGLIRSDGVYPTCLASEDDSPISMDRHRVELTVLDWDTGGVQRVHIAVRVRCLD
jgi:hypothetical protein